MFEDEMWIGRGAQVCALQLVEVTLMTARAIVLNGWCKFCEISSHIAQTWNTKISSITVRVRSDTQLCTQDQSSFIPPYLLLQVMDRVYFCLDALSI